EEDLFAAAGVYAKVQRKSNSKRKDEPHERFLKEYMRWSNRDRLLSDKSADAPQHPCCYPTGLLA
ncbi:MAG: hypothetical protein ICV79_24000, partial [Flavisolibacter sp.]|nr:hypothetical protein [Flavisolibacter sp.]